MLDNRQQLRFVNSCADASFGYANAMLAAYAVTSQQVMDFWLAQARAAGPARQAESAESWYRPSQPPRTAYRGNRSMPRSWFRAEPENDTSVASTPDFGWAAWPTAAPVAPTAWNPMAAWLAMMPMSAVPATWPFAYGMIAYGVPRSVAWPTAQANVAVIDAMETASEAFKPVYSSYHNGSGFAATQFWPASPRASVNSLPFFMAAWPGMKLIGF